MGYYALEDIDDALAAVRAFLLPFEWRRWWRLAVVAVFVGGAGLGAPGGGGGGGGGGTGGAVDGAATVPDSVVWLLLGTVALLALLGIAYVVVGSVMQFVLVESLRRERVEIRSYFRGHFWKGIRLLAFRIGLGLVGLVAFGVLGALVILPFAFDVPILAALTVLIAVPVGIVAGLALALASGFTTAFVVPAMLVADCGVVEGWRRVWPALRANPIEVVAYVLVTVGIAIARGIVVPIVLLAAAVLLLLPFGILGAVGFALLQVSGTVGVVVLAVVGLLYLLALVAAYGFVQAPVISYVRYYALLVLGDLDPDLDLIPERRAAIRADSGDLAGGDASGDGEANGPGDQANGPGDQANGPGDQANGPGDEGSGPGDGGTPGEGSTDDRDAGRD